MAEEKKPLNKKMLLFFAAAFIFGCIGVFALRYHLPTADVILGGERLHVLVANTPDRQFRGLSGRDTLAPYDGMLFLMGEPDTYAFVMRGMKFPIDIIWLNAGAVVDIAPDLPLPAPGISENQLIRYRPRKPATMVLEVPAGWARAHGVVIGSIMTQP